MRESTFNIIVDHIFPIRTQIQTFDYPDYSGLPKKVVNILSSESVDALQDVLQIHFVRKRDFKQAYKKRMIELGEIIKG